MITLVLKHNLMLFTMTFTQLSHENRAGFTQKSCLVCPEVKRKIQVDYFDLKYIVYSWGTDQKQRTGQRLELVHNTQGGCLMSTSKFCLFVKNHDVDHCFPGPRWSNIGQSYPPFRQLDLVRQSKVVYHLPQFPENSCWDVNGKRFLVHSTGKSQDKQKF